MVSTRRQAMERAALATTYPVGYCARWVRTMYDVAPSGDVDRDGDVDAVDSWKRATRKHPGDRNPPPGVPAYWSGGRSGHGHIAITWPNGRIRGTDSPTAGQIGTVDLEWVERNWGLKYLGWSEDIHGILIPTEVIKPRYPKSIREAIKAARAALSDPTTGPTRRKRIEAALAELRKVRKS